MQPTASQAATAQGVGDLPTGATAGRRALHAVTPAPRTNGARGPRPRAACATGVEVPPLSSVGAGRSARSAVSSPLPEQLRYLPDARSSPGSPPRLAGTCRRECRGASRPDAPTTREGAVDARDVSPPPELDVGRFGCMRFPPNGFAASLTLFPKCFSPFPHGTCSLSVSCRYLALDGVYHPLWAALPNNPTLRRRQRPSETPPRTGLSPSPTCLSRSTSTESRRVHPPLPATIRWRSTPEIACSSCSRFARRYWGNPG